MNRDSVCKMYISDVYVIFYVFVIYNFFSQWLRAASSPVNIGLQERIDDSVVSNCILDFFVHVFLLDFILYNY